MNKFALSYVTFLLLVASSALSQDVKFDYDDKVDFSQFKTYKWVAFKNAAPIDNLTDEQIRSTTK
jgi:hypothetical protein